MSTDTTAVLGEERRKPDCWEIRHVSGRVICDINDASGPRDAIRRARAVTDSYAAGIPEGELVASPVYED